MLKLHGIRLFKILYISPKIMKIDATLVSFPLWGQATGFKGEPYANRPALPFPLYGRPPGYKELDCLESATHALRNVTGEETTVVTEFSVLDPCNRA